MALLQYEFSVVGEHVVNRALASIERRAVQSARTIDRAFGGRGSTMSAAARATGSRAQSADRNLGRQYDQIGRAARAAVLKQARDEISAAKQVEREKIASIKRVEREQVSAGKRAATAAASQAKAQTRARERFAAGAVGRLGNAVSGATRAVTLGAGALGIGGGAAVVGALQDDMRERAAASKLAAQMGAPEKKGELLKQARGVQGFSGEEVLGGMRGFFAKAGDLGPLMKMLPELGQLALATDTDFKELGESLGLAFSGIRDQIKDPIEQMKAMREVARGLAAQTAEGAVEMNELAVHAGELVAASRQFKGGSADMIRTMGALAQLSVQRGGAASGAEAATAVARLPTDIIKHQKEFKAMGIDVFADKSRTIMKPIEETLGEAMEKTKGDLVKLQKLGFGEESIKAFKGVSPIYTEAEAKKKGSGRQAMLDELHRWTKMTVAPEEIQKRAASRLADPDLMIKEASKNFNVAISQHLMPVMIKLIPRFAELAPRVATVAEAFAKVAEWFAANPFKGIGALVGAHLIKELAAAGIGNILQRAIAGATPGGVGTGAGGAVGGGLGLATGAAAVGVGFAADQAGRLQKELGTKGSFADILPGVSGGSFSADTLMGDLINPFQKADRLKQALIETMAKGHDIGKPVGERIELQKANPVTVPLPAGAPGSAPVEVKGGTELLASAKALSDAATALKAAPTMPNRSNSPSPVKP